MTTESANSSTSLADVVGTWNLDPADTTIEFRTKAMWVLPVKGHLHASSGAGTVAEDGAVTGSVIIDAASISTGNAKRDKHLRTDDFFDTDTHPSFTFQVSGASVTGPGRATLDGSLTIKGVERPMKADVSFSHSGDSVDIDATIADLDRREWGVTWAKMGAGVHNSLVVHARFLRA